MKRFLFSNCSLAKLSKETLQTCKSFSCGDSDLDDFFTNDSDNFRKQLLGKSYYFYLNDDKTVVVCVFTLSNSSIDSRHLSGSRRKKLTENIPHEKSLSSYPATLIGRLGVNNDFQGEKIGSDLILFLKAWLLEEENRTACRFLTVDAYNNEKTLRYYEKNGFLYLFSSEQQEKNFIGMPKDKELKTRLMYFDLLKL